MNALASIATGPVPVSPKVTQETLGPKEARKYLLANTHNRTVSQPVVRGYARDMRAGRWFAAVEVVTFDYNGVLLNGQHTLMAIVEASVNAGRDVYASVIVVRGQDPAAQDVMDAGRKRTSSDQLRLHGEPNANVLSAALRLALIIDLFGPETPTALFSLPPTHEEMFQYLADNPSIRDSISPTLPAAREVKYPQGISVALHFLMAKRDRAAADTFWDKVGTGSGLEIGDPIFALRRAMVNDLTTREHMDRMPRTAMTIKAWNAWRMGNKVRLLAWKTGESFPTIG